MGYMPVCLSIFFLLNTGYAISSDIRGELSDAPSDQNHLNAQLRTTDVELNQAYTSALNSASDTGKKRLKAGQLAWLKQRNKECWVDFKEADQERWFRAVFRVPYKALCVVRLTKERTTELQRELAGTNDDGITKKKRSLSDFTLTKGLGIEVCEAYTERLNRTEYEQQPALPRCGRPENTEVDGFKSLTRVRLTPEQLYELHEQLLGFANHRNQDYFDSERKRKLEFCSKPGFESICRTFLLEKASSESTGKRWLAWWSLNDLRQGWIFAWRYEPEIDIDDDGKPDPVLLYQSYRCDHVQESPTYAFVMDETYRRVDEARTAAVFGHASQKIPGLSGEVKRFRFLGTSFGVFEYKNKFYFDTFERSPGDFYDKNLPSENGGPLTLGVFDNDLSSSRLVCEIHWNDLHGTPLDK